MCAGRTQLQLLDIFQGMVRGASWAQQGRRMSSMWMAHRLAQEVPGGQRSGCTALVSPLVSPTCVNSNSSPPPTCVLQQQTASPAVGAVHHRKSTC